jgi:galactonate dehydratase
MSEQTNQGDGPDRRDWMATAAAAAAVALVNDIAHAADQPGKQVEDRASAIRITGLKATTFGGFLYVKVETNRGIVGWGETAGLEPHSAAALVHSFSQLLVGENPTRIEYLWQMLYRAHRDIRGGPFMVHTISAIDQALWDIAGKLHGVPVYRLLGGPVRDKIRWYNNKFAHKAPPYGIYAHAGSPPDIDNMVRAIADARKAVGPKGAVMFDAHCAIPPATLIQFAAAIKPYDVLFIEEPAVPGNIEVFKRLKEQIHIPLAAGERDRTIWEFAPYLHERCLDILQPDVSHSGGITQMLKIAALAEAYHTPLAPHCTNTLLGLSASMHAIAAVPLFLIHETNLSATPKGLVRADWKDHNDGYAGLPSGPGLGVEVDAKELERLSKLPSEWKWPVSGRLKDGSIADY